VVLPADAIADSAKDGAINDAVEGTMEKSNIQW